MIEIDPLALAEIESLGRFYFEKGRDAAIRNLDRQIDIAVRQLEGGTNRSRPAPSAFPGLAAPDRAWLTCGPYWFVHTLTVPPVILRIFHEAADIPTRYAP